ncbi:MAG: hypothetical protein IJ087_19760 [Eggerthellaceae bacterium]|nr:hypothetical protein [Eggerthellaceae bacterium]
MAYMNDEKLTKQRFVQEELTGMLHSATNGCVGECWYEFDGANELVRVSYRPDPKTSEVITVNVTADSRWAIAKDVMRAVAKRFE